MELRHIKLQIDAKPDNPWVKDYMNLAHLWERIAEKHKAVISGLISPYQLHAEIEIPFDGQPPIQIEIDKQLGSYSGGHARPIISDLKIHFGSLLPKGKELKVVEQNIENRIYGLLAGYKQASLKNSLCLYKDPAVRNKLDLDLITKLKEFVSIKLGPKKSVLHLRAIPEKEIKAEELLAICKKIKSDIQEMR